MPLPVRNWFTSHSRVQFRFVNNQLVTVSPLHRVLNQAVPKFASFLPLSLSLFWVKRNATTRDSTVDVRVHVNRLAIVNHDNSRYIIRLAPDKSPRERYFPYIRWKKSLGEGARDITCFSTTKIIARVFFFFFFTFPFLSHSRRECAPRHAAPVRRLLVLLPHRRESGHRVSCVHQVRKN